MASSVEQRIQKLRAELNRHNHLYYIEARPEISDREFDRLLQELIELERAHPELITPDSPSQRVGGEVQTELKPVRHAVPMMSIDNTYSEEEVRAFDERVRKALGGAQPAYVLEPKIDGTAVSLRYENGSLVLGATRGRGNVGDDITVNARTIRSIPLTLRTDGAPVPPPAIVEVRGEVYMDNDDFQRVNKEIEAEGEEPYANPRNLTAGTLRRLDPNIVAKRRLRFLAHGLGQVEPMPATSYWEWTQLLRAWGLPLPKEVWLVENVDEAIKCIHEFEKKRPKLPYMTDGMVMKVSDFAQRDRLGATSKAPRWLIAYKYETEQQPTVLKDVRWQVGKSGKLTPVADVEPVFIGGVTVTHATLHNIDQIRRLDIHFGDTIVIERAGEVIPYVLEVVREKRPGKARPVEPPKQCPSCGSPVEQQEGTPEIRCPNPDCPAQLREQLIWFAGRTQMDLDRLGEKIIEQLVERGHVRTFPDFFTLEAEQLAALTRETQISEARADVISKSVEAAKPKWPDLKDSNEYLELRGDLRARLRWVAKQLDIKGLTDNLIEQLVTSGAVKTLDDLFMLSPKTVAALTQSVKVGHKTAEKIIESIEAAKARGLSRVLASLGIRLVGATAARKFAEWAKDFRTLSAATVDQLAEVLAKDPEAKKASISIERRVADELYRALHPSAGEGLFDDRQAAQPTAKSMTADFLRVRDAGLTREKRLGSARTRKLAECFPSLDELEAASRDALVDCLLPGIAVARSLYEFLHSPRGTKIFKELQEVGVKLTEATAPSARSEWTGKTVVVTGSFDDYSRSEIEKRLRSLGAVVTSAVSSKTDALFVGSDPGASKTKAAEEHSVRTYDSQVVSRIMKS